MASRVCAAPANRGRPMIQDIMCMEPGTDGAEILRALERGQTVQLDQCMKNDLGEAGGAIEEHSAMLSLIGLFDAHEVTQIRLALEEAAANAIIHGNLEIDKSLRENDYLEWMMMVKERPLVPPYCDRRVRIRIRISPSQLEYEVSDEGRGFDVASLATPGKEGVVLTCGGRGMMLIRSAMDGVSHSEGGKRLTMFKRRKAREEDKGAGNP